MTLEFHFHPEAGAEFDAANDWYDDREAGLGGRSADAVRASVDATGFPYRVVYFVQDNRLRIVAVAHSKRKPGYWQERVGE